MHLSASQLARLASSSASFVLLWSACGAQRADVIERGAQPVLFHLQVIAGLQVHPEPLRGAEVPGQAQRGVLPSVRVDARVHHGADQLADGTGR